ncbi:uncharacterized protein LOC116852462 isoform X1 [Odontomachus brunneus]|uniref:uncharacterized protein LOC116852462 isoform X1 n=1 Tax=Odontomachus brunneus TaxID=486640 RepID=UPI0013F2A8CF|nr:uncharacterized protein LOC116852462 isoform X1 [Odontomachus brunneus]
MERRRRLRLQLYETLYEESTSSSETSHHSNINEEELLVLEESDANIDMQEQFEQEQIENSSQSEGNISVHENNSDWSENTRDSMNNVTDSMSDEYDEGVYLRVALAEWASRGVSKKKVNNLLHILHRVHPELPKTYITLLETPKTTVISEIDNGLVWYKGVKRNLYSSLTQEYVNIYGLIRLNINIDGLPLDNSGKLHFWPILGSLADMTCKPFIISVYFGKESKPTTLEQFLEEFVQEMEELFINGFEFNGYVYNVSIHNFICDAPARSFLKCTIGHNGLFSCEKCEVEGEWYHNRMIYLKNGQKRTDKSFIDRRNPEYHLGLSPLEERLNIGMVSQFRLEYLHLVCLGTMKRFMMRLLEIRNRGKLKDENIEAFKNTSAWIGQFIPKEFNQKPYRFKKVAHLKATEIRRFLLYDGVKIMKDHTPHEIYHTFLLLHCSIYILAAPLFVQNVAMKNAAREFLNLFIQCSSQVFSRDFVVSNVHGLTHLVDECDEHGSLDSFSAFPYENYLKTIKDSLRSGYYPLQQLARRDAETNGCLSEPKTIFEGIKLTGNHFNPNEIVEGIHYKKLTNNKFTLRCVTPDHCFKTEDGSVVLLRNIVQSENNIVILRGQRFQTQNNYYQYPMDSSLLGIVLVSQLDDKIRSWEMNDAIMKCVLIPENEMSYLCIPLAHSSSGIL